MANLLPPMAFIIQLVISGKKRELALVLQIKVTTEICIALGDSVNAFRGSDQGNRYESSLSKAAASVDHEARSIQGPETQRSSL